MSNIKEITFINIFNKVVINSLPTTDSDIFLSPIANVEYNNLQK